MLGCPILATAALVPCCLFVFHFYINVDENKGCKPVRFQSGSGPDFVINAWGGGGRESLHISEMSHKF